MEPGYVSSRVKRMRKLGFHPLHVYFIVEGMEEEYEKFWEKKQPRTREIFEFSIFNELSIPEAVEELKEGYWKAGTIYKHRRELYLKGILGRVKYVDRNKAVEKTSELRSIVFDFPLDQVSLFMVMKRPGEEIKTLNLSGSGGLRKSYNIFILLLSNLLSNPHREALRLFFE